jgi:putative ABC transport system ATP-binding protein
MVQDQVLLSVNDLGRQVADRWLWRRVTFTLQSGERLGLVAPSGAGKTLLLRSIVRLDPLQEGKIIFAGKASEAWSLPAMRRRVIYLPQRATAFAGTVEDNLQRVLQLGTSQEHKPSTPGNRGKYPYDRRRILDWLHQLGRSPAFLQLQAPQLSGGETQILALLRALQLDPQVLLLDEPTASLDPETTDQVEMLLKDWLQGDNRACLLTSHDRQQIQRFTTRQLNLTEFR